MKTRIATEDAKPDSVQRLVRRHQGYIIEIAEGGPWLAQDGTVTINWGERGVWHELTDAELALARSLSPNVEL